jgi:hypothetical protein
MLFLVPSHHTTLVEAGKWKNFANYDVICKFTVLTLPKPIKAVTLRHGH